MAATAPTECVPEVGGAEASQAPFERRPFTMGNLLAQRTTDTQLWVETAAGSIEAGVCQFDLSYQ